MCKPTLCVRACRNVCTCMKASKLVPQWTRPRTASALTWSPHFYLCVPGSLTLMSTDPPVSASCLASGALSDVTDVCCCAHPYGGFWKAQLSSSHKKQTPRSLVQYLSLIARKRAKTAFLSKIFSFCLGSESVPGPCSFCIMSTLAANL